MNRSELVKTLQLLKPALATNSQIPIFQCYCFDKGITAYNDSIAVKAPTEFDVGSAVGLHGPTLLGLLSSSNSEEVDFTQKGQEVTVTMGRSVSKLPFQASDSFIFTPPDGPADCILKLNQSFFDALEICLETVSRDETQAALQGVTIEGSKLYSCDGDVITRVDIKAGAKGHRALMPTAFCNALVSLWSELEMTSGVLNFNNEWIWAELADYSVYGRVLEIPNPIDFEAEIKATLKGKPVAKSLPDGFSGALSRARVLADPESQKTTITITKNEMKLTTSTHMGTVKDSLPFNHGDVTAEVNAAYLQRAIRHCDQMAILENCCLFQKTPNVLQIVSNMG